MVWNGAGVCGMRKAVANAIKEMADQQLVDSEKQMAELRQQLGKTAAELAAALQQVQKLRMLEVRLEEDITRERQRNQELEELNGRLRRARGLAAALVHSFAKRLQPCVPGHCTAHMGRRPAFTFLWTRRYVSRQRCSLAEDSLDWLLTAQRSHVPMPTGPVRQRHGRARRSHLYPCRRCGTNAAPHVCTT